MTRIAVTCYMGHTVRLRRKTLQKLETWDTRIQEQEGDWVLFLWTFTIDRYYLFILTCFLTSPCAPPGSISGSGLSPGSFQGARGESVQTLGNHEGRSM